MRLNTRTCIGLILALAVAVALVWQLNRAPRAGEAAGGTPAAPPVALQFSNLTPAQATAVASAAAPRFDVVATNVPNAPFTNFFAHRLTNSALPFEQMLRSDFSVLLRNALLDTRLGAPAIPAHLRAAGDPGAYIVQARGLITDEFRNELRRAGVEIVSYVPNNAYLVRASAGAIRALRGSPFTQSVLPFEPYYKLDARLLALAVNGQLSPHALINVVTYPRGAAEARAALEKIGVRIVTEAEPTVFGDVLVVKAGADQLPALAQASSVQMLGVHFEKRLMNDLTRPLIRVSPTVLSATNPPVYPPAEYYSNNVTGRNLTGQGVLVAVADSGVDETHPDFSGRVTTIATPDYDGHGTHVVGTILGDGTQSPRPPYLSPGSTNPQPAAYGSRTNAVFSGMAPRATAFVQDFRLPDAVMQRNTALSNAPISNNSWGRPGANDYDIFAASFDAAVRDSLPGVTGEQQVAYVFAAGNDGNGGDNGLNGIPGSIVSPATAKNVITVGASDLPRFITNRVSRAGETNMPWYGMTDTNNQVSPYSSRGNVGIGSEGLAGRFKPDVVAPGSMLVSTRSRHYLEANEGTNTIPFTYNGLTVNFNRTNLYALTIPPNAVSVTIVTRSNVLSPPNLTLQVAADMNAIPDPGLVGINTVTLNSTTVPPLAAGTMYYTVANQFHANTLVSFDLVVFLTVTNDFGDFYTVLADMNAPLKVGDQGYRYEAGTSMAAPAVSGFLALIQEFLGTNSLRPSPALLKAMIINGARSLSANYNLQINAPVNHQGWGLANLSNSLPGGFNVQGTNGPMRIYDRALTNGLATGGVETYEISVPDSARSFPLRVTLVWTDPPGNPITGVKLVNDMNLTVETGASNALGTNTLKWVGNNFGPGANFVEPLTVASNATQVVGEGTLDLSRDFVNNVENIFIRPPLARKYTLQVKAHRVNVNAINSHTNRHAQDYALVISSGNFAPSNTVNLAVTDPVFTNDVNLRRFAQMIPAPIRTNGAIGSASAGLLNQRVGANNPLIVSTNGATNQWSFFSYTNVNDASYTNVVILTFLAPNLSLPRYRDADIDLYVTRGSQPNAFNLTNRDDVVIAGSLRSVGRTGTEYVYLQNAQAGEVFYIGVKSEDQQAANFSVYAESRNGPFSGRDASNNIIVDAIGPFLIPDGSPDNPGGTNALMFVLSPEDLQSIVQRVWVTNSIYHEQAGDLVGILSRPGGTNAVALNNHRTWTGWENPVFPYGVVYDDSNQGDLGTPTTIPPVFFPDGPGRLLDYLGEQAGPVWNFTVSDNALFHTGFLNAVTVVIEPGATNGGDSDVLLDQRVCVRSGTWLYRAVNIPSDAYNLEICVSEFERAITVPLEIYVRGGGFPDLTNYDHFFDALPPGECFNIGLGDNPPLMTGRYIIGFFNGDAQDVCLRVRATISRKSIPGPYLRYTSTDTPKALLDNATTNSTIFVPEYGRISDLFVGLRVDHERASDLAFHLTSPSGTRLLLMENRGRTNARGIGINFTNVVTNVVRTLIKDGFDYAFGSGTSARPVTDYSVGEYISGWRVDSPNVEVVYNSYGMLVPPHSSSNAIDLIGTVGPGSVSTNVATTAGKTYRLQFVYCKNPGGPAQSQTAQVELNSSPAFSFTHNVGNSYFNLNWQTNISYFQAASNTTKVGFKQVNPPSGNSASGMFIDTVLLQEVDIQTNEFIYLTFTENTNLTTTPIKFGVPPYTNYNVVAGTNAGSVALDDGFESALRISYNAGVCSGWAVVRAGVDVLGFPTGPGLVVDSGTNCIDLSSTSPGRIATNVTVLPNTLYRLSFAYSKNPDAQSNPGALVRIDGTNVMNIVANQVNASWANVTWQSTSTVFRTTGTVARVEFDATTPGTTGVLLDSVRISEEGSTSGTLASYYLPEEPMTPFFGEQAHGEWNLEVWDSRLGGAVTNTPSLVSWKLEIAFPQTNPPLTLLTNNVTFTGTVSGANAAFFAVDVPCAIGHVTNILSCLTSPSSGLNLVFNQYVLPTNGPLDVLLLGNVTNLGVSVLTNGQVPLVDPVRYYLAVSNVNPNETNEFALTILTDCGPRPIRLTNNLASCRTITAGGFQRYDYITAPNVVALRIETFGANGNVNLYARQIFNPQPAPGQFHFAGTNAGNTNELIFVTTNSTPPLIPVVWNFGVTNVDPVTVNYCIRVREIYDTNAVAVVLGHAPTNQTLPPNDIDYYMVNVDTNFCSVTLSLANHTNGNLNVSMFFRGPRPDFSTPALAPGVPPNITTNAVLNRFGTWIIAVENPNAVAVNYDFRASGVLCVPFAPIIRVDYSSYTTNGLFLEWDAPRTEIYEVQFTIDLTPPISWTPIPPPAVSYDGLFLFLDPSATNDVQRFYRLLRVP